MTPSTGSILFAEAGGLLLLPVGLLAVAFWMWMIVDCATREAEGSTKIAWLLVILFAGLAGAPLYFLFRKLPRQRRARYQPPVPVYQPWPKDERLG